MKSVSEIMAGQILLPIIQVENEQDGVNVAKAMAAGGITSVEVVLRSERSADAIKAIKAELPDLVVSAGTIIDEKSLEAALDAKADFIVTPAATERLIGALKECGTPVIPGVSTVSDIILAREHGYTEMKLFPAELSGGAPFLKAVGSVFKDVKFCPTGGVSLGNFGQYMALSNVFAAGGTWVAKPDWVKAGQWDLITKACADAISLG